MSGDLEADVREFILACGSVSQLEVVLLLRRRPEAWTPTRVAEELGITPEAASAQLSTLHDWGLLVPDPATFGYRYAPRVPELAALVDKVATAYAERRVRVIRLIYSRPATAVRQFSEAFRLRREDDDDA